MPITDSLSERARPQTWDQVVGQNEVINSLKPTIQKRDTHAFLFIGPSGTGKTTLAEICARELGCKRPISINAAKFTSIDDMRTITDGLQYRPLDTEKIKALIIDEVHRLSPNALDSLLIPLERPPAHAYWFLCTTQGAKIIDTIRRRCAVYNLKPVSTNLLFDYLRYVADQEEFTVSDQVLDLCAQEADGSPGKAIAALSVCAYAKDRAEAASLLRSAEESPGAIALCRALAQGENWESLRKILLDLQDTNPESIRHVVNSYFVKVILNNSKNTQRPLAILDAFREPFNASDGLAPVILAVGELAFN